MAVTPKQTAILSESPFGVQIQAGTIWRQRYRRYHVVDFRYAARTGSSTIKQLAVANVTVRPVQVFVSPVLLPR